MIGRLGEGRLDSILEKVPELKASGGGIDLSDSLKTIEVGLKKRRRGSRRSRSRRWDRKSGDESFLPSLEEYEAQIRAQRREREPKDYVSAMMEAIKGLYGVLGSKYDYALNAGKALLGRWKKKKKEAAPARAFHNWYTLLVRPDKLKLLLLQIHKKYYPKNKGTRKLYIETGEALSGWFILQDYMQKIMGSLNSISSDYSVGSADLKLADSYGY